MRTGKADLASVGARAWDRMGVTSFRPLVAPFAIDGLEHERRVLEDPGAARALEGVRPLGLVGVALLPGPLRRPLGVTQALLAPDDYAGATFGLRFGRVAQSSLEALGAMPAGYRIGSLAGLDGAELDLTTIVRNGYDLPGSQLTANLVLWARPETVVISRRAYERLPQVQRDVLRRAGRAAVATVAARLAREEKESLAVLCGRGALSLVEASAEDVAALRAAVRPVYAELRRDARARALLARIEALRSSGGSQSDTLRCGAQPTAASALEGTWEATVSRAAMRAAGASAAEAATYGGHGTLELRDGRWTFRTGRSTVTGTYAVGGGIVRLTMRTCTANPCEPGKTTGYAWSVYRDTLSLVRSPNRPFWPVLVAALRHRAG